jgi:hypothetical protein
VADLAIDSDPMIDNLKEGTDIGELAGVVQRALQGLELYEVRRLRRHGCLIRRAGSGTVQI